LVILGMRRLLVRIARTQPRRTGVRLQRLVQLREGGG
jgi:hypothetical protein